MINWITFFFKWIFCLPFLKVQRDSAKWKLYCFMACICHPSRSTLLYVLIICLLSTNLSTSPKECNPFVWVEQSVYKVLQDINDYVEMKHGGFKLFCGVIGWSWWTILNKICMNNCGYRMHCLSSHFFKYVSIMVGWWVEWSINTCFNRPIGKNIL